MKQIFILSCLIFLLFAGCKNNATSYRTETDDTATAKKTGEFYHYSIWAALVNKVYDGTLTVKEARNYGDIGLGTYNGADGELVLVDGVFYHVPSSGKVLKADDSAHIPYLNASFFEKEFS